MQTTFFNKTETNCYTKKCSKTLIREQPFGKSKKHHGHYNSCRHSKSLFHLSPGLVNSTMIFIRITCPCDLYPLTPHFYIVKMGFTGVYIIFLFLL